MKKLYVIIMLFMCISLTACTNNDTKEVISLDEFNNAFTNGGFIVSDNKSYYSDASYISDAMIAQLDDNITVEMVIYNTDEYAKEALNNVIDNFELLKSTNSYINKYKGKNYYKYTMIANGYYMISSRVDNTLIFSKTLIDNKDTLDTILSELNY